MLFFYVSTIHDIVLFSVSCSSLRFFFSLFFSTLLFPTSSLFTLHPPISSFIFHHLLCSPLLISSCSLIFSFPLLRPLFPPSSLSLFSSLFFIFFVPILLLSSSSLFSFPLVLPSSLVLPSCSSLLCFPLILPSSPSRLFFPLRLLPACSSLLFFPLLLRLLPSSSSSLLFFPFLVLLPSSSSSRFFFPPH